MNYYNIFAGNQSVIDGDIKNLPKFWLNFYDADATCYHVGWPLKIKRCLEVNENVPSYYQKNFYVNALTYIGLSFIGLSLIKYFRIKKLITNH